MSESVLTPIHKVTMMYLFKYLLKMLEPRYKVPSRAYMNQSMVPAIYSRTRRMVEHELAAAEAVALTTVDGPLVLLKATSL